jgi:hypothetical protein
MVAANVWHKHRCVADVTEHLVLVCCYIRGFGFVIPVQFRVFVQQSACLCGCFY